ncbi:MAG: helix-turn-helix transcriptional regulator [Candidatus Nanopelagicales bacterium]
MGNVPYPVTDQIFPTTGQIPLPPPRLSTAGAAEFTGLAESTLRYYRHAGIGPASYTVGSKVFYDLSDLTDWLAAQKAATLRGGVK